MGKFQRRILIALLLSVSVLALWGLFELYRAWYETLVAWQVHGLFFMWLLAFALSILCAPFFMQSAGSKEEYEQAGAVEITKLYLLVLGIMSTALIVVFFLLWCVGMLMHYFTVFTQWLRAVTIGR